MAAAAGAGGRAQAAPATEVKILLSNMEWK